jgi:excisionase family DNA binding protein
MQRDARTFTTSSTGDHALPAVLTVEEAGEFLRIGRSAAYSAVRSGTIPAIRVGKTIRVPRQALERMLAGEESS